MAADPVAAAKKLTCDLVCEGGGVKGIGLAGAFETLEQAGYAPGHAAGTSAGAMSRPILERLGFRGVAEIRIYLDEFGRS